MGRPKFKTLQKKIRLDQILKATSQLNAAINVMPEEGTMHMGQGGDFDYKQKFGIKLPNNPWEKISIPTLGKDSSSKLSTRPRISSHLK